MKRPEVFSLLFALCIVLISAEEQYCAWYGQMSDLIPPRPCVAKNITAQPINNTEAEAILQKRCPHFFENDGLYLDYSFKEFFCIWETIENR